LTAKDHALLAKVFLAALHGCTLSINRESDGFRVVFDSLQIGKTYHVQQSVNLFHWEELASVCALDSDGDQAVRPSLSCCFYRLLCLD
jgi:hypothetical protein